MVIADRQTGSIWTHLDGEAFQGELEGARLEILPLHHTSWEQWLALHPDTTALSYDTPFEARYREVSIGRANGAFADELLTVDERLPSNELVLGVLARDQFVTYPLDTLEQAGGVLNDEIAGIPVVVFFDEDAMSAVAYSRVVDGGVLEFRATNGETFAATDESGTIWDFSGRSQTGAGDLQFIASYLTEWYGWSAYHPGTEIRTGATS